MARARATRAAARVSRAADGERRPARAVALLAASDGRNILRPRRGLSRARAARICGALQHHLATACDGHNRDAVKVTVGRHDPGGGLGARWVLASATRLGPSGCGGDHDPAARVGAASGYGDRGRSPRAGASAWRVAAMIVADRLVLRSGSITEYLKIVQNGCKQCLYGPCTL